MGEEKKTTAPVSSVGADGAQPNVKNHTEIIANSQKQINLQAMQSHDKRMNVFLNHTHLSSKIIKT